MKKNLHRLLCALTCVVFTAMLIPVSAHAVTLTAVNDTLLPLSDGTMPIRLGGELYVPYSVFTSIGVSASSEDNVLNLSAGGVTLSFSPDEGYVYDQNLNSYSSPAYYRNDTVYVPVKLCCGTFGLGYSTIDVAGETVLRVTDGSAQSDSDFTSSNAANIESAINTYKGIVPIAPEPPEPVPPAPVEPPIPEVEEHPAYHPARVYLAFFGAPNSHTAAILDALRDSGRTASFFLPVDSSTWDDDAVRRLVAEGHTPALLLDAASSSSPSDLTTMLHAANERLILLSGISTRIAANLSGASQLTIEQRNALDNAGYRLWDSTLAAEDDTQSAGRAYAVAAQYFASTHETIVLRLHHAQATAETVLSLSSYMMRQGIPSARITLNTEPILSIEAE